MYKRNGNLIDQEIEVKHWTHPANSFKIIEGQVLENEANEHTIQINTDGSKNEHGFGSGEAIFVGKELKAQLKFKLDNRCSNNQAEQLAIAKVLEIIDAKDIAESSPRTIGIFTDSRITIDSLKNVNNRS